MPNPVGDGYFDWNQRGDGVVVARTQMGIAVYYNPHGDVCIRQEGQFHPDEDAWILASPEVAKALANRILELLEASGAERTKDPTAAERQRRHRDRKRDNRDVTAEGAEETLPGLADGATQ